MALSFDLYAWGRDREWERSLVTHLRRGGTIGAMTLSDVSAYDHADHQALSWEVAEGLAENADRGGSPFLNDLAIARRSARRVALKQAYREAVAERRAQRELERPAREAAKREKLARVAAQEAGRAEAYRSWLEMRDKRKREQAERDAEWERAEAKAKAEPEAKAEADWERLGATLAAKRFHEERAILMNKWQCQKCKRVAHIASKGKGYVMTCAPCVVEAVGSHAELLKMLPRVAA